MTIVFNQEGKDNGFVADQHPEIVDHLLTQHSRWGQRVNQATRSPAERSTLAEMHGEIVELIF